MSKCVRCGACRVVCPVFEAVKTEGSSPRGKINLIYSLLEDKVSLKKTKNYLYMCTLCQACENVCPNKVPYKKPLLKVREIISKKGLFDIKKKIQVEFVKHKNILKLASKFQYIFKNFLEKDLLKTGLLIKLPPSQFIPKFSEEKFFLEDNFFKSSLAKNYLKYFNVYEDEEKYVISPKDNSFKTQVLFFVGCALNYFYPEIALDTLFILTYFKYRVIIPKKQVCCGASAYFSGLKKDFENFKKENEDIFKKYKNDYDFIVTSCATGNGILKKVYNLETYLISQVIYENLEEDLLYPYATKVAYHYPCHFIRGLSLKKDLIENIFKKVKNVVLLSWEKEDTCCGMAGSFKISYPEISENILKSKMENLKTIQPQVLATECPGCLMQLAEGIEKFGDYPLKIKHIASFIKEALENKLYS